MGNTRVIALLQSIAQQAVLLQGLPEVTDNMPYGDIELLIQIDNDLDAMGEM